MEKRIVKVCVVIPARGGSKSVPKKNIRLLGGTPLIGYSIQYSLACPLVSHTVVSTDSEEISEVARECGAEVPFIRPAELGGDDVPDYPVFRHALENLEHLFNAQIELLVLMRPTSPLRPPGLIERGVDLLMRHPQADSVRAVTYTKQHPFRQWKIVGQYIEGYETTVPEPYNLPRQQLPPVFFQTGDIEIIRRKTILGGSISGRRILPIIVEPEDVVDIDCIADFNKATEVLHGKHKKV